MIALLLAAALPAAVLPAASVVAGEDSIAPYVESDANAGAKPFSGQRMWRAFHGQPGVDRIVDDLLVRVQNDSRIADVFKGHDMVRLHRTLKEQFCYILNGGCAYSGRTMTAAHKDLGLQRADFNALVEDLQAAMRHEGVAFFAQNAFLAKLAPMQREAVER